MTPIQKKKRFTVRVRDGTLGCFAHVIRPDLSLSGFIQRVNISINKVIVDRDCVVGFVGAEGHDEHYPSNRSVRTKEFGKTEGTTDSARFWR